MNYYITCSRCYICTHIHTHTHTHTHTHARTHVHMYTDYRCTDIHIVYIYIFEKKFLRILMQK